MELVDCFHGQTIFSRIFEIRRDRKKDKNQSFCDFFWKKSNNETFLWNFRKTKKQFFDFAKKLIALWLRCSALSGQVQVGLAQQVGSEWHHTLACLHSHSVQRSGRQRAPAFFGTPSNSQPGSSGFRCSGESPNMLFGVYRCLERRRRRMRAEDGSGSRAEQLSSQQDIHIFSSTSGRSSQRS